MFVFRVFLEIRFSIERFATETAAVFVDHALRTGATSKVVGSVRLRDASR